MKYETRNFTKKYAKDLTDNIREIIDSVEIELEHLQTDLKNYQTIQKYLDCKSKLGEIYTKKANRVRMQSKCGWYKSSETSKKLFLNLEKTHAS